MKALLYKDFRILGWFGVVLCIIAVFAVSLSYGLAGLGSGDSSFSFYCDVWSYSSAIVPLIIILDRESKSKFDRYSLFLPIERAYSVHSGFVFFLLFAFADFVFSVSWRMVYCYVTSDTFTLLDFGFQLCSLMIGMAIAGISLFFCYAVGSKVSSGTFFVTFALISFAWGFVNGYIDESGANAALLSGTEAHIVGGIFGTVIFFAEWIASVMIYCRRENI